MRNRILFILQLPPPVHGASLVNQLIVESHFLEESYDIKILPLKFVSQINEIGNFSFRKIAMVIPFVFRLIWHLIFFRPQLVYYTIAPKGGAFYRDAFFMLFIKLFRRKTILHLHSRGIQRAMSEGSIKRRIYRFVYRNAFVVCLADELRSEFNDLSFRKIFILPNGIPDNNKDSSTKKSTSEPSILFLSNLLIAKGIYVFVEAMEKLAKMNLQFRASMVGMDGDLTTSRLSALVEEKKLSNILKVPGPRYGEEKLNAFATADIFVMPSLDEAFPLTILEAMQASDAIVASSVGAIPSMIDNGVTGFVCEPGNVDAFVEKIAALIKDPASRQKMGQQARNVFEKKYSVDVFEKNLEKIIVEVLAEKK